jgi:hypothetical protein
MTSLAPSAGSAPGTTAEASRTRVPLALRIILLPFAFSVLIKVAGSFIFSFSTGTLEGYVWGSGLVAAGLLYLFLMFRLHRGEPVMWRTAVGLVAADIAFNIYKVFGEGEAESRLILGAAVLSMVLLLLPSVRRFVGSRP